MKAKMKAKKTEYILHGAYGDLSRVVYDARELSLHYYKTSTSAIGPRWEYAIVSGPHMGHYEARTDLYKAGRL